MTLGLTILAGNLFKSAIFASWSDLSTLESVCLSSALASNLIAAHSWSPHTWSVTLNILKLIGAVLAGTAGVVAALSETKTPDKKHLSRAGWILLSLGIFGFAITLCSQVVEWVKAAYDAEEAQRQNAIVLSEIRRAVTRLETISFNIYMHIPVDDPGFKVYRDRLDAGITGLIDNYAHVAECHAGIEAVTKHTDDWEHAVIKICSDEGLPTKERDGLAATLIIDTVPRIALYKTPVDIALFRKLFNPAPADLHLMPIATAPNITGVLDEAGKLEGISLQRSALIAPPDKWYPSGEIVSVEDLVGAEAVIYMPWTESAPAESMWKQSGVSVMFYFNHQLVRLDRDATPAVDATGQQVFTYIFKREDFQKAR